MLFYKRPTIIDTALDLVASLRCNFMELFKFSFTTNTYGQQIYIYNIIIYIYNTRKCNHIVSTSDRCTALCRQDMFFFIY